MHPPQSIMVAVDFGDASARAVALAGRLAQRAGATLRLLHVENIEAPPYFTPDQLDALERQREATRAQAEQYLTRFGRHNTKYPFVAAVANGSPARAILEEANRADLIVMGTHRRHAPRDWWIGSVAERVRRATARPLLIVREDGGVVAHAPDGQEAAALDRYVHLVLGETS